MNAIPPSLIPPTRGLDKEEPEFAEEDDIPSDDNAVDETSSAGQDSSDAVERE